MIRSQRSALRWEDPSFVVRPRSRTRPSPRPKPRSWPGARGWLWEGDYTYHCSFR